MYAVVGSTGQVGGAVVRALRAQGKEVRALLRDPEKSAGLEAQGAEAFLAPTEDPSLVEQAFQGVEGVFVMTPPLLGAPDPREENALIVASIKHALQAAHVKKVVLLSSFGAELEEGTGMILKVHDLEKAILALPLHAASIRAASFMENMAPLYGMAKESGKLPVMLEPVDKAVDMVATEDIGKLAAELLTSEWTGHRIIEFTGPAKYSMQDVAAAMSKKAGRPVETMLVPQIDQKATFEKFGATSGAADLMVEMTDGLNQGRIAFHGGEGVEQQRGTTTFEDVLGR